MTVIGLLQNNHSECQFSKTVRNNPTFHVINYAQRVAHGTRNRDKFAVSSTYLKMQRMTFYVQYEYDILVLL